MVRLQCNSTIKNKEYMKYLKKFNEELNPRTYRSAAAKLLKQSPFNKERVEDLNTWADKREMVEDSAKWEKMKAETSKFGTYNLSIENNADGEDFVGRFHPYITFERDGFLPQLLHSMMILEAIKMILILAIVREVLYLRDLYFLYGH